MSRGRKQKISARLRVSRIEKALEKRHDLSIEERRSLRARKNTANHRERKKQADLLRHFYDVELDEILSTVSENLYLSSHLAIVSTKSDAVAVAL